MWFIGHFVGDIHQPMHIGYPHDRGGNDHLLEFADGRQTNMHSLWDGQIIEHMELIHNKNYFSEKVDQKISQFLNVFHENEITLKRPYNDWSNPNCRIYLVLGERGLGV